MLEWLQALLPSCRVTNFTHDWSNGLFLLVLINEIKQGVVPGIDKLDQANRHSNCTLAIRTASTHLKIPPILRPDDLSSNSIDELSVMTYLSYFCKPAEAMLLRWVKATIPNMKISNFSSDWSNGLALAAILEACYPGMFPEWNQLKPEEGTSNVTQVFAIVKARLGVTPQMTAEELTSGKVEDLKVMAYILRIRNGELLTTPVEVMATGPGLSSVIVGKQTYFTINTALAGPGQLHIDAQDAKGNKVTFSLTQIKSSFMVKYTPLHASDIKFDISWSDQPIANSPFVVSVLDSDSIRIVDLESHPNIVHTNRLIQLDVDTSTSGYGFVTAQFSYDDGRGTIPVTMAPKGKVVALTYTPVMAGEATLKLFWNKEELPHLAVHYTVVDHTAYKVVSHPDKRLYSTFDSANFTVETSGPPLGQLQMTAIFGDVQIPISFQMIDGSIGHASFVPTLSGKFRVEVACVGQLVEGSPFLVEVADPSRCVMKTHLPKHLAVGVAHEFVIGTKDAGVGEVRFLCQDGQNTEENFGTTLTQDSDGTQHLFVTPLREGEFAVGLSFCNAFIVGSPFALITCNPSQCAAIGKYDDAVVGVPVEIAIFVPSPLVRPVVKATGRTANYNATVTTSDSVNYNVTFVPWEVGRHQVAITYGSYPIPGTPVEFDVSPQKGGAYTATGAGLQSALTGVPAQFCILTRVVGLLESGSLDISVRGVINRAEGRVRSRDNNDGTYSVAYLVHEQGSYLVTVQVAGQHIVGSPFRLTALPGPTASKCRMYGNALDEEAVLIVGKPIEFSVDTSDAGSGKLSVKAQGPQGIEAKVFLAKSQRTGVTDVKLDPFTSGKHRVSVKWADVHVPGSPFVMRIWPGVDPSKCKAYGPGLRDGVVGRPSYFTIDTRNAGAGVLALRLRGMKNAFRITMKPADEVDRRTMLAQYDPQLPGDYLISILWSDQHIPGSPFRVRINGTNTEKPNDGLATPLHSHVDLAAQLADDEQPKSKQPKSSGISAAGSIQSVNMPNFSTVHTNQLITQTASSTSIAKKAPKIFKSAKKTKGADEPSASNRKGKRQNPNQPVYVGEATVVQVKSKKKKRMR